MRWEIDAPARLFSAPRPYAFRRGHKEAFTVEFTSLRGKKHILDESRIEIVQLGVSASINKLCKGEDAKKIDLLEEMDHLARENKLTIQITNVSGKLRLIVLIPPHQSTLIDEMFKLNNPCHAFKWELAVRACLK